jgi:tetraprenyl-beta-curcumene synthase
MVRQTARAGVALVLANFRYWTSVAPTVGQQLARWELLAQAIPDPLMRGLAQSKLQEERFNVEVAATLATLADPSHRRHTVEAIVALQVMYDYLDLLSERPPPDQSIDPRRLFEALTDAVTLGEPLDGDYYHLHTESPDGGYLQDLVRTVKLAVAKLPAAEVTSTIMRSSAERCALAQVQSHAATPSETVELRLWARKEATGTGLGWHEFLAGATASVLSMHALIAAAADSRTTRVDAERIDRAYLSICALTMLDSVVDRRKDLASGTLNYVELYERDALMAVRLASLAREATDRVGTLPNSPHHIVTLVGVVAYYSSAATAQSLSGRQLTKPVRKELRPLLTPTLALMRGWRLRKWMRSRWKTSSATSLSREETPPSRVALSLALCVLFLAGPVTIGPAEAKGATRQQRAHIMRTLKASDTAHLHYVSASGSLLYEEGGASGTLPGSMRVHFSVGATFSGRFTIYTRWGTITGHGTAIPHGSGVYESFAGMLLVTGGSGHYTHARGRAGLYGSFNRSNYGLIVQTTGTLLY